MRHAIMFTTTTTAAAAPLTYLKHVRRRTYEKQEGKIIGSRSPHSVSVPKTDTEFTPRDQTRLL